eukprot:SAG31_NODE_7307_length_1724_cov_1.358154_1_plen_74_part_10
MDPPTQDLSKSEQMQQDPEVVLASMEAVLPQFEDERAVLAEVVTAAAALGAYATVHAALTFGDGSLGHEVPICP